MADTGCPLGSKERGHVRQLLSPPDSARFDGGFPCNELRSPEKVPDERSHTLSHTIVDLTGEEGAVATDTEPASERPTSEHEAVEGTAISCTESHVTDQTGQMEELLGKIRDLERVLAAKGDALVEKNEEVYQLMFDNAEMGIALVHHAETINAAMNSIRPATKLQLRRGILRRLRQNNLFTQKLDTLQQTRINEQNGEENDSPEMSLDGLSKDNFDESTEESNADVILEKQMIQRTRGVIINMRKRFPFFVHCKLSTNLNTILDNIHSGTYSTTCEIKEDVSKIKELAAARYGRGGFAESHAKDLEQTFGFAWVDNVQKENDPDYIPESLSGSSGGSSDLDWA